MYGFLKALPVRRLRKIFEADHNLCAVRIRHFSLAAICHDARFADFIDIGLTEA